MCYCALESLSGLERVLKLAPLTRLGRERGAHVETHLEIHPENHLEINLKIHPDIHCEIYPETHPEIYADLHLENQEPILKLASDWT